MAEPNCAEIESDEETLKSDAVYITQNILSSRSAGKVLATMLPEFVKCYEADRERNFCQIAEFLGDWTNLEDGDIQNLADFEKLVHFMESERPDRIDDLLLNLLNLKSFSSVHFLQKLIPNLEDAILESLQIQAETCTPSKGLLTSLTFSSNYDDAPHFVTFILGSHSESERVEVLLALKKYEDLSCKRVFLREFQHCRNWLPEFVVNQLTQSGHDLDTCYFYIILARKFDYSLKTWLQMTWKQRRRLLPDYVESQLRIAKILFSELQKLIERNLVHPGLTPENFYMIKFFNQRLPIGFGMPSAEQLMSSVEETKEVDTKSDIYDVGLMMLAVLSVLENTDKLKEVVATLIKSGEGNKTDLQKLHEYSPILSSCTSLRNLVTRMIHSDERRMNASNFAALDIDWDEFGWDFFQIRDNSLEQDLADGEIESSFMKIKGKETSLIVNDDKKIDGFSDRAANRVREFEKIMSNFNEFTDQILKEWPWVLTAFLLNFRKNDICTNEEDSEGLPTPKLIRTPWPDKFQMSLCHLGQYGYILTHNSLIDETIKESEVAILIPKLCNGLDSIRSLPFGKPLTVNGNVMQFSRFYEDVKKRVQHSDEIRDYISPEMLDVREYGPQIQEIIQSDVLLEIWLIKLPTIGHNLRHFLDHFNPQCEQSQCVRIEIVCNIMTDLCQLFGNGVIHQHLNPGNIYFSPNPGDNVYQLPMRLTDFTLTQSVKDQVNFPKMYQAPEWDTEPTISSNIYSLGIILAELFLPEEFKEFHRTPDNRLPEANTICSILQENVGKTIEAEFAETICKMLHTNVNERMSYKDFETLNITSSGIETCLEAVTPGHEPTTDLDILDDLHILVGETVLKTLRPEIVSLSENLGFNFNEFVEKARCGFYAFGELQKFSAIFKAHEFTGVSDLVDCILENRIPCHGVLFRELLEKHGSHFNDSFKSRLLSCIDDNWIFRFTSTQPVGHGASGIVLKCNETSYKGRGLDHNCAVKIILPHPEDEKDVANVKAEIEMLENLNHPNIISMADSIEEHDFTQMELQHLVNYDGDFWPDEDEDSYGSDVLIINNSNAVECFILSCPKLPAKGWLILMELAGSNLRQWLNSSFEQRLRFDVATCQMQLKIIRGLIRGMKYLQVKGVMHSDLKPDNILFSKDEHSDDETPFQFPITIADFGLSRSFVDSFPESLSHRGNLRYQAPEIRDGVGYTITSELYSIGVIILEILVPIVHPTMKLVEGLPIKSKSSRTLFDSLEKLENANCSRDEENRNAVDVVVEMLQKLIQTNPFKRMTFDEFQKFDVDWIQISENPQELGMRLRELI